MNLTHGRYRASWFAIAVVALVPRSNAGDGGCTPNDGTYSFYRLTPPPAQVVGTGIFSAGDPSRCNVNPGTSQEDDFFQGEDGQYRPDPEDGRSFCVHDGSPITYEYKYLGDVISTGQLNP